MASRKRFWLQLTLTLGLIIAGVLAFLILTMSRPPLAKRQPPANYPRVRVVTVAMERTPVTVRSEGTVAPLRQSELVSQVAGEIIKVSPALAAGGSFHKDQVLARVDPRDFELKVTQARAKVHEAETALKLAQEEAQVSRQEWERLAKRRGEQSHTPPPLVAKEPQLKAAKATLLAAKAALQDAELDLERTAITAPFEGRVASKSVDLGQYVRLGDRVAVLHSTEAAEITVYLEGDDLAWLEVPGMTTTQSQGSPATVTVNVAGRNSTWNGRVVRAGGQVDETTRLVPVVVRVEKPYDRLPPLTVGLYARVSIQGRVLERAASLPRAALKPGETVWVVDNEGALRFRKVEVARYTTESALVTGGVEPGDRVVTSILGTATDGMQVKPIEIGEEKS